MAAGFVAACATVPSAAPAIVPLTWNAHGNPCVAVQWNEREPAVLMFATAADGVFITREASARMPSLVFGAATTVTSWGGSGTLRTSRGNTLRLGGRMWRDLEVTEDELSGPDTDGKFGLGLFGDAFVLFDPERGELRVSDRAPDLAGFTPVSVQRDGGSWYAAAELGLGADRLPHRFLLHTGFAGGVLLDDAFVAAHGLAAHLPVTGTRVLKDALGNDVVVQRVCVPELHLGGNVLRDVAAERFPGGLGDRSAGVLGCAVLRRFRLLFDLRRSTLWLQGTDPSREEARESPK